MKIQKALFFLTLFIFLFSIINIVHAETETVDISEFPQQLSNALNIPLFAGQLLTSSLLICFFMFPTFILARKSWMVHFMVGLMVMSVCVAIGWLPYWLLLIVVLLVASLWGTKIKGWLS